MTDKKLKAMLDQAQRRGFELGVKLMEQKIVQACNNGTPLYIEGRCFFPKSDIQNLHDIFADLEANATKRGA